MIRLVYMGTPHFAVAPLAKLIENKYDIAAVVTIADKVQGRGLKLSQSAVKEFALQNNIPVLQPVSLKDPIFLQELRSFNADLFIVVAFRMLPKDVWAMPKMGTFNLHGSLLPMYRGAAPINWAIINGEKKSGVSTFFLDEQIDTGNILLQAESTITNDDTFGTLHDKLMVIGADLVLKTVEDIINKNLNPVSQSTIIEQEKIEQIKQAPKLTKELCKINWQKSAKEIELLVRGLSPYPAALGIISNGEKSFDVKIFMSNALCKESLNEQDITSKELIVGKIISDNKKFIHVVCGNGELLSISELQLAGKKRMSVKEFLAGFRNIDSYRFTS